ncbi:MAG: hypothetical protein L6R42_000170 [Xanthoria sp. 1 TBL-2021]|nr:MAG: hypothetical protein L6R42_000170 [Xanthoria sp. 1 TBL-2021]
MLLQLLLVTSIAVTPVFSCADHTGRQRGHLSPRHLKRQEASSNGSNPALDVTNSSEPSVDWAYDASYDWGAIQPDYSTCQTGTQQSPIALTLTNGLSLYHHPTFDGYDRNVTGNWTNWSYGPSFTLDHLPDDYTTLPSMSYDNVTAYLKGWHIHAPADHSVGGDRSKAEMHLVNVDKTGHEVAVLAIRLDPGTAEMPFFTQLPEMIPFVTGPSRIPSNDVAPGQPARTVKPAVVEDVSMNMELALDRVDRVNEFWTYKGSLTSPPCGEGIRWFVARTIAFTSVDQMKMILGASTYSARQEQEVWLHEINSA